MSVYNCKFYNGFDWILFYCRIFYSIILFFCRALCKSEYLQRMQVSKRNKAIESESHVGASIKFSHRQQQSLFPFHPIFER